MVWCWFTVGLGVGWGWLQAGLRPWFSVRLGLLSRVGFGLVLSFGRVSGGFRAG